MSRTACLVLVCALLLSACGSSASSESAIDQTVVARVEATRLAQVDTATATTELFAATATMSTEALSAVPASSTALAESIEPTPTPEPTPTVPPTNTPKPVATLAPSPTPLPEPPPEYTHPEQGIYLAFEAIAGGPINRVDPAPAVEYFLERALMTRNLFHLATAEVGYYNASYDGYFDWLVDFIGEWFEPITDEHLAERERFYGNLRKQVWIGLTEPNSAIGSTIRGMEFEIEQAVPGSGPLVYWLYLVGPVAYSGTFTSNQEETLEDIFWGQASSYESARIKGDIRRPDFAAHLVSTGFAETFDETPAPSRPSPTPTPRPTATPIPQPSTNAGVPADDTILYNRPLTEWFTSEDADGWFRVADGTFRIGVYGDGTEQVKGAWTIQDDFANISATVDIRARTPGVNSMACLSVRHHVDLGDYNFCIGSDGTTSAWYDYADASGTWRYDLLLTPYDRVETGPATHWNTLKIVVSGDQLWFIANGRVVGSARHNARSTGSVALYVTNWDTHTAEFEFRNLVVRSLR